MRHSHSINAPGTLLYDDQDEDLFEGRGPRSGWLKTDPTRSTKDV